MILQKIQVIHKTNNPLIFKEFPIKNPVKISTSRFQNPYLLIKYEIFTTEIPQKL